VGTEHSFRQWGLARDEQLGATPGLPAGGEPPREHSRTLHPAVPAQAADDQDGLSVLPRRRRPPVLVADNGRPVDTIPRQGGPAGRTDARQAEPEPAPAPQALPRRVRQASLAPQLRADATEETAGPPAQAQGDGESRERSPEEVRARMASIQSGWQRGRRHSDEGPDVTPATPAPRTITEGNGP
jgi:hypothetical protein